MPSGDDRLKTERIFYGGCPTSSMLKFVFRLLMGYMRAEPRKGSRRG